MAARKVTVKAYGATPLDLLALRSVLVSGHSLFAYLCMVYRPYLVEIQAGYGGLADIMPTRYWGFMAALVVAAILLSRNRAGGQVLAQLASGMLLSIITVAVTTKIGPNLSTASYLVLAAASLWSFSRYLAIWAQQRNWFLVIQRRLGWGRHGG